MSRYKLLLHSLSGLILMTSLTACNLDDPKPLGEDSTGATFYVQDVEVQGSLGEESFQNQKLANWGFSQTIRFDYTVCLNDMNYKESIEGHRFKVSQEGWSTEITTDNEGCGSWSRKFPFEFIADPLYVEDSYQISSKGIHTGQTDLRLAINPWKQAHGLSIEEAYWLHRQQPSYFVPMNKREAALAGDFTRPGWPQLKPRIWLSRLSLKLGTAHPKKDGAHMNVNLTGWAKLDLRDETGNTHTLDLDRGLFELKLLAVRENRLKQDSGTDVKIEAINNLQHPLTQRLQRAEVEGGILRSEFESVFVDRPTEGTIGLYLQMIPHPSLGERAYSRIGIYTGYYILGSAEKFEGEVTGVIETNKMVTQTVQEQIFKAFDFKPFDEPLSLSKEQNLKDLQNKGLGDRRAVDRFYFTVMGFKYGGIDRETKTGTYREVKLIASTCALDPWQMKTLKRREDFRLHIYPAIPGKDFDESRIPINQRPLTVIEDLEGAAEEALDAVRTTEEDHRDLSSRIEDGCLAWTDEIGHQWYHQEQFYVRPYVLEHKKTGIKHRLYAAVNPWDTGWLFARDLREVSRERLKETVEDQPHLLIDHYQFTAIGTHYNIDDDLTLEVGKNYNMRILPVVIRHDSLSRGNFGNTQLSGGFYLLRVALVRSFDYPNYRPDSYITSFERVVAARAGRIATPVTFMIDDLALMNIRPFIFIELLPVDHNKVIFEEGYSHLDPLQRKVDHKKTLAQESLVVENSGLTPQTFFAPFIPSFEDQGKVVDEMMNITVKEIIESGERLKRQKEEERRAQHSLRAFDIRNRLLSLNLDNEEDRKWLMSGTSKLSQEDLDQLLPLMLEEGPIQWDKEDAFAQKMCAFWVSSFLPKMLSRFAEENQYINERMARLGQTNKISELNPNLLNKLMWGFYSECLGTVGHEYGFFNIDKKVMVKDIDQDSVNYLGGASFNYNIASNYDLKKSEDWSVRRGHGSDVSFSASTGWALPGRAIHGINLELGGRRADNYFSDETHGFDMGFGSSFHLGLAAYLVIQHSVFQFDITDYSKCIIIKPRWRAMIEFMRTTMGEVLGDDESKLNSDSETDRWNMPMFISPTYRDDTMKEAFSSLIPDDRKLDVMESGLRICKDYENPPPISARENYYYVTQHFTTGDMHDPRDRRNRPWILEIRSVRDFTVYLHSIHRESKLPQVGRLTYSPNETLSEAYVQYHERTPAWPSVYTLQGYDPHYDRECSGEVSFVDEIWSGVQDLVTLQEPFTYKDGFGVDFNPVFYCPLKGRNGIPDNGDPGRNH